MSRAWVGDRRLEIARACGMLSAVTALFMAACVPHQAPVAPPVPQVKPATTLAKAKAKAPVPRHGQVATIDLDGLTALQQSGKVLLLDVRPSFVTPFGRIPGAVTWPRRAFTEELPRHEPEIKAALAAGRTVVLYCTDLECPDSHFIADRLAALGYPVSVLQGGFGAWKEAGLPTEK